MNTPIHSLRRQSAWFLGGALIAGGLAWSVSAFAGNADNTKVSVKFDDHPIVRVEQPDGSGSFAPMVKRVGPSVVKVLVTERAKNVPVQNLPQIFNDPLFRQFFGNQLQGQFGRQPQLQQPPEQGLGSGVIVSADGYILTNNHVVNGADTIKVSLNDGRELTAKVVGTDPQSDLAVIKVEAAGLPAITFADSDKVEVGDRVLAVGNPFGIGQTVTSGMVSAMGRQAQLGLDYEDFIQTDAAINPGNSGGALVDVQGRLVGINTAILSHSGGFQGIGFAIPSNLARNIMEQLSTGGKVVRGFIGVNVQDVTPALADEFKLKEHTGALVAEVTPGSPAEKAGLQSGDVITTLEGKSVADARHLKLSVGSLAPNTKVSLGIVRDGKSQTLALKIGQPPGERALARTGRSGGRNEPAAPAAADDDEGTLNGVGVADLDAQMRREFGVPVSIRGAVVTEVKPDSAAAAAGLEPGDVIQEINRQPVSSADVAVKLTEKPDTKRTLLRIWSQKGPRYVIVDETGGSGSSG